MSHHLPILTEIFPNKTLSQISEVIRTVETECATEDDEDVKFEHMINLLSESGDSTLAINCLPDDNAYGLDPVLQQKCDELLRIFPEADPNFMLDFCSWRGSDLDMDAAIDELCRDGFERVKHSPQIILEQLVQLLPDADPDYLGNQAYTLARNFSEENITQFIDNALENHNYPSREEYLKKKEVDNKLSTYKEKFTIAKFLEQVDNPVQHFNDPTRKLALENENVTDEDRKYVQNFLYNRYRCIKHNYIDMLFRREKNIVEICRRLDRLPRSFRKPRPLMELGGCRNTEILQVLAYIKHQKQIQHELKLRDDRYAQAKKEAIRYGLLETCNCCFDEELIPEEVYFCRNGCTFCKECLKKGSEVEVGKGELTINCFICESNFSLRTLQMVMDKKLFKKIEKKLQNEDIIKANLEGAEVCNFCGFVAFVSASDRIFKCQNNDCLRETCRECGHESHLPKRCNEMEYDEDVKLRTYIENKMTEALIRKCFNCQKVFVKESGCNKITCECHAKMCYVCGSQNINYNHFGENRCPLYTENLNEYHLTRVRQGANNAKQELGDVQVKFDPTINLEGFFNN